MSKHKDLILNADVILAGIIVLFICEYFAFHSFLTDAIPADVNMY